MLKSQSILEVDHDHAALFLNHVFNPPSIFPKEHFLLLREGAVLLIMKVGLSIPVILDLEDEEAGNLAIAGILPRKTSGDALVN